MSQSLLYHSFGVRKGYEYERTEYLDGGVQFHLAVKDELLVCPCCDSRHVIRKGWRERLLKTVPIGLKPVTLVTEVPKCECKDCGHKFEIAPFLPRPMRGTRKSSKRLSTR